MALFFFPTHEITYIAAEKGYDQNIENYEPEAVNKILGDFHATVRKEDGKDYMSMAVFALQLNVT